MDTATLLAGVGCVVLVKTAAFVTVVVRRDRRQRTALEAARGTAEAAAALVEGRSRPSDPTDPSHLSGWRLQWSEPGVLLVQNTSDRAAAREVRLDASLTAGSGVVSTVRALERFVGTGASFAVRFTELEASLSAAAAEALAAPDEEREQVRRRLACTLSHTLVWTTPEGDLRREARTAQPVVPVPDLALFPA